MGIESTPEKAIRSAENSADVLEKRQEELRKKAEENQFNPAVAENLMDALLILQGEKGWDPYGVNFGSISTPEVLRMASETNNPIELADKIDETLRMEKAA